MAALATQVDWSDIQPLQQEDGPSPVVQIQYTPQYRELMDLFRGVCAKEEFSERTLALSAEVIGSNPANYTAWHFRRRALDALQSDLNQELRFIEEVAYDTPKNYQIWYHRRVIVGKLGDPSVELQFVANILEDDAKNYHAWSHRQWVLKTYNLWANELEFIDSLLTNDPYNNSAWNQRWFVVSNTEDVTSHEVTERELAFAWKWIWQHPSNESAWNYLRGWLRGKTDGVFQWRSAFFPEVKRQCMELKATENGGPCTFLSALLVDILQLELSSCDEASKPAIVEMLGQLFVELEDLDSIRAGYWHKRKADTPGLFDSEEVIGSHNGAHVIIEAVDE